MKQANEIRVSSYDARVTCPHCGYEENSGWIQDPRGLVAKCDECEEEFDVHEEATVILT